MVVRMLVLCHDIPDIILGVIRVLMLLLWSAKAEEELALSIFKWINKSRAKNTLHHGIRGTLGQHTLLQHQVVSLLAA